MAYLGQSLIIYLQHPTVSMSLFILIAFLWIGSSFLKLWNSKLVSRVFCKVLNQCWVRVEGLYYIPVWYTITNACGAMLVFKYISSAKWRSHVELLISLTSYYSFVSCIQSQRGSLAGNKKEINILNLSQHINLDWQRCIESPGFYLIPVICK